MIIIWGRKQYAKMMPEQRNGHCTCCNSGTRFEITDVFDKATIYYIPTFSVNHKYYARCVQCGAYFQIKDGATSLVFGRNKDMPIDPADMKLVQEGTISSRTTDASGAEYDDPFAAQNAAPPADQIAPWEKQPEVKPPAPGSGAKVIGIMALVVAIIAGLISAGSFRLYRRIQSEGITPINELLANGDPIKEGQYVSMDVNAVIAQYASETEKSTETGYYIVWLDDSSFISVSTSRSEERKTLEEIEQQTWDYLDGKTQDFTSDPLIIKGRVRDITKLNYKIGLYFNEALEAIGVDGITNRVHRFNILSNPDLGTSKDAITGLAVAGGSLVAAIILFVISGRQKKRAAEIEKSGMPAQETDIFTSFPDGL